MSALDFTEAEVLEELRDLGYDNVPRDKLEEFMTDLKQLMRHHDDSRRSRDEADVSFASSVSGVDDHANASSISSDGLARYPHHTDFHWGRGHHRRGGDKSNNNADAVGDDVDVSVASTPRSAFEKSKVPLDENSFYNESFFSQNEKKGGSNRRRQHHPHHHSLHISNAVDDDRTSPKRLVNDHSIASSASSSANSLVVRRKVSRRDANGNRDISTHELTYVEDDEDDAATLAGDDAVLDYDDTEAPDLTMTRRIVGRRPRSAGSESSDASSTCSSRALPSFIRPQPEVRRRRCDPVNRY